LIDLLSIGSPSLLRQLLGLLSGFIQLLGHGVQIGADGLYVLHLLLVLEVTEWLLDVLLDALGI